MRTFLLWIAAAVALVVFVAALHLWVPALNFQLFSLGLAALEWAPWFLLVAIACMIVSLLGIRLHPTLAKVTLTLCLVAIGLIGHRLWITLQTQPTILSEMPEVTTIAQPSFDLAKFVRAPQPNSTVTNNVMYANIDNTSLSMDIYQPISDFTTPSIVVIHGGSWRTGARSEIAETSAYWAGLGYTVFDVSYRLAPDNPFPAQIEDIYCALSFIEDHAQEWNTDPSRTVLIGRSAGAHIALVSGYSFNDPTYRTRCNPTKTTITGVIGFYSPTRLAYYDTIKPSLVDGALDNYLGGPPEEFPDVYEQARPANLVNAETPPTMLLHGGRDQFVRTKDTWELIDVLDRNNRPFVGIELPYANHGWDFSPRGPSNQLVQPYVDQFLATVLKSASATSNK